MNYFKLRLIVSDHLISLHDYSDFSSNSVSDTRACLINFLSHYNR